MLAIQNTDETHDLIASDRVEGTLVYNLEGEKLGAITRFMVNKRTGKAHYAVLRYGGILGLGSVHYPLPWQILTYDRARDAYVVNIAKEQLEQGPHHSETDTPAYDQAYTGQIHAHYGVTYI
ncbi:PRC-barrel domain-containing protein [Novosphingobium sp. KACC 22771]|uniref:PRC-barrel domain-containing protein n=1 Tax=Novosphingobium sp. KACC 22771 TaxID=3025670 RepID=UPI002365A324|nr:PRC-barrel domain-containing protein [Novosphingobium sp. KACC 22771]WDF74035.1 PRC-barrel domain-containing protein [Novosphingobium sp. KACC 22771]